MAKILEHYIVPILSLIFLSHATVAQQSDSTKKQKKVYCKCSIKGLPRAKALTIKYEYRPNYKITSTDKTGYYGNSTGRIKSNGRTEIKFKVPVINKPYLSIIAGFKYNKEEYNFE